MSKYLGSVSDTLFVKTGNQGNQWNEEIVDLSNYSGVIHFKITAIKGGNFYGDMAIDNFEVETPSCASPSGLTTSNVTISSVDIAWTAGGSETAWNIEIGAPNFAVGTGSGTIANINTNPFTIQNLSASTSYDIYLQADCGSGQFSPWVGPVSITTPYVAASAPYFENFDSGFPVCWSQATTDDADWTLDANGTTSSVYRAI